jgi:hypothetical protein
MPKTSYATALDWFVIMCFACVFASLVEYASINYLDVRQKQLADEKKKQEDAAKKEVPVIAEPIKGEAVQGRTSRIDDSFHQVDQNRPTFSSFHPQSTSTPIPTSVSMRRRPGDFQMMFPVLPPAPIDLVNVPYPSASVATIRPRVTMSRPPTPRHLLTSPAVMDPSVHVNVEVIEPAPDEASESEQDDDEMNIDVSSDDEPAHPPFGFDFVEPDAIVHPTASFTRPHSSSTPYLHDRGRHQGHESNLLSPMTSSISRLGRRLSATLHTGLPAATSNILNKLPSLHIAPPPPGTPEKSHVIDIYARRFFPFVFTIMNSIYWLLYLYYFTDVDDDDPVE